MKTLKERITDLFKSPPPVITENSSLNEIGIHYPEIFSFIERKYGIRLEAADRAGSLIELVEKHHLPPSQVVFMEVQFSSRAKAISQVTAVEAGNLILKKSVLVLDVRESWESKYGSLPHSQPLTPLLLDEILNSDDKERFILIYCHFGIRSLDAATFLCDRGFKNVFVLKGGIDSWSQSVDPTLPRYTGSYC